MNIALVLLFPKYDLPEFCAFKISRDVKNFVFKKIEKFRFFVNISDINYVNIFIQSDTFTNIHIYL